MKHLDPKELSITEVYQLLIGGVAPRPIALVATVSKDKILNLAPYSFFNAFGVNPPIVAFSPVSRVRDGTNKDSFHNLKETGECTIQMVSYDMVQQVNLASTEFSEEIDEFEKSGLTPIPSDLVSAPRVLESPFQMECRLFKIVPLGDGKGAGNLMLCEVVKFHVAKRIFLDDSLNPNAIDLVGRNNGDYYTRANGNALFEVDRPGKAFGMGFDNLPDFIKNSHVLSANNLGKLASIPTLPDKNEVLKFFNQYKTQEISEPSKLLRLKFNRYLQNDDYKKMLPLAICFKIDKKEHSNIFLEQTVNKALIKNDMDFAWKAAMIIPMES